MAGNRLQALPCPTGGSTFQGSPADLLPIKPGSLQHPGQVIAGRLRFRIQSTGKKVDRHVAVFRPTVKGQVRLLEQDHHRQTMRMERVADHLDQRQTRQPDRLNETTSHEPFIIDLLGRAVKKLQQVMGAYGVHVFRIHFQVHGAGTSLVRQVLRCDPLMTMLKSGWSPVWHGPADIQ